jgi:hypothetical protein
MPRRSVRPRAVVARRATQHRSPWRPPPPPSPVDSRSHGCTCCPRVKIESKVHGPCRVRRGPSPRAPVLAGLSAPCEPRGVGRLAGLSDCGAQREIGGVEFDAATVVPPPAKRPVVVACLGRVDCPPRSGAVAARWWAGCPARQKTRGRLGVLSQGPGRYRVSAAAVPPDTTAAPTM